jgi:hypothetical protein
VVVFSKEEEDADSVAESLDAPGSSTAMAFPMLEVAVVAAADVASDIVGSGPAPLA